MPGRFSAVGMESTEVSNLSKFNHHSRQERFGALLGERGIDLAFFPVSGDLEYLTGFPRKVASFGNIEHAHARLLGGLIAPGKDPLFLVNQGYASFNLPQGVEGDVVYVKNLDDSVNMFQEAIGRFGNLGTVGISARTWGTTAIQIMEAAADARLVDVSDMLGQMRRIKEPIELEAMTTASRICDAVMKEVTPLVAEGAMEIAIAGEVDRLMQVHGGRTPSFDTGVWAMGPGSGRDATKRTSMDPLPSAVGVSFDFGTVVDGYCSDFGRTIHIGEPDGRYVDAYNTVIAAQEAGRKAATPGTSAADVHSAVVSVIDEAGYGEWFRHRTGHCIGLDTHEKPFISEEDQTLLEAGMTFTIEPSIFWPGTVGVRVEDLFVCAENGAESLNDYPHEMVVV